MQRFMKLDTSNSFLNELWRGTMQSLLDRTREDGFCLTSFGEEGGVKCYGECHYSRDASEAAWVLADQGCLDPAVKILEYTLFHTPAEQYHIVHAYRPDGTPLHNNIQIDTPAHPARALARALEMGACHNTLPRLFDALGKAFDAAFKHHFHETFQLLDSGNYNEQLGGGREPVLDLFTNAAMYSGCLALDRAAELLGVPDDGYRRKAETLAAGIEANLYDPEADCYLAAIRPDGSRFEHEFNWISLYPERWYPGRPEAWKKSCDRLWERGCNDWYGSQIPSGETGFMKFRTMGKVIGHMLGFCARNDEARRLETLLGFLEQTVRKPADLYPEYWLHHLPEPGRSPYLDWFFREFRGVWNGFREDPAGDYTVDSGNCEQCSVFLASFSNDVAGFSGDWRSVRVAPDMPGTGRVAVSGRSLGFREGREIRGGFELAGGVLRFQADAPVRKLELVLPDGRCAVFSEVRAAEC